MTFAPSQVQLYEEPEKPRNALDYLKNNFAGREELLVEIQGHKDEKKELQTKLAEAQIWSRIFPYNARWLRLGLPPADGWDRLEHALR